MVVTLVGPLHNHYVQRVLLVAAYAGIRLKVASIAEGEDNTTENYRLNCSPLGGVPVLKTDEGYLFEHGAMVRLLARTEVMLTAVASDVEKIPHPQYPVTYAMYGHTLSQTGEVDAWLDFALRRLDGITRVYQRYEQQGGAAPSAAVRERLWRHLGGLETRLKLLSQSRRQLLEQSQGSLTARTTLRTARNGDEFDDEMLMEEEVAMRTRDSRLSSVYNVADSIRARMDERERPVRDKTREDIRKQSELLDSDASRHASAAPTPRPSALMSTRLSRSARPSTAGGAPTGSLIQRHDLIFLVGDSLTAADLIIAMALHQLYNVTGIGEKVVRSFSACHKFYEKILTLPVASDIRKALGIKLVSTLR